MARQNFSEADVKKMGLVWDVEKGMYIKNTRRNGRMEFNFNNYKNYSTPIGRPEIKKGIAFTGHRKDIDARKLIFQWVGKHISLNEWYSSKHWSHRNKVAKEWHEFFKKFLITPRPQFARYCITLQYNSKLDPSNTITLVKLLEDCLQKEGIISNDNKDNCKKIEIMPDLTMKPKSYKIIVAEA